jgi:predicted nucleotidyltransferase
MKTIIQEKLASLEKENDVRILFACESGSRAWGFPSTDSDYDVRFVYARPYDSYLSLKTPKDTLSTERADQRE